MARSYRNLLRRLYYISDVIAACLRAFPRNSRLTIRIFYVLRHAMRVLFNHLPPPSNPWIHREPRNTAPPKTLFVAHSISYFSCPAALLFSLLADGKIGLYETGSANLFAQLFEKRRFNNGVILSLSLFLSEKGFREKSVRIRE